MEQKNTQPTPQSSCTWEGLEEFVGEHRQGFIEGVLEEEVTALLERPKSVRRTAVDAPVGYRNGYGKPRRLSLTSGTMTVRRPRVGGLSERFASRVLPLFQPRTQVVGALLPELYLHGLALGDFELALRGLLGEGVPLSPSSLARLKGHWQGEYETWKKRGLDDLNVVYVWADGRYVKAGLEDPKAALLVMIGALSDGRKVVLAVQSGQRESKESWGMLLRDLPKRGLAPWRCTIADGALGLWAALGEQYPDLAEQRCWNHKLVHVLDALPTTHQATASALLRAMPYAQSQATCETLRNQFTARYQAVAPKAVERLYDDWERLVTFYQFPQAPWVPLRTTNIVESPFARVRLRTTAAKRFKKVENATAMIWKLLQVADASFRRLKGAELLPAVYAGARYVDGVKQVTPTPQRMAA